jgi:uncharacterized protein YjbI with pentapeptide repeats
MENTTHFSFSLPTPVYLGILVFAVLFALGVTVHVIRTRMQKTDDRNDGLRAKLGVPGFHFVPFFMCAALWTAITIVLIAGLFGLILDVLADVVPDPDTDREVWNFRFKLIQITALTTVLGAVIALPFTLLRLGLSQKQTETARESLFNEKINAATQGLYARRQVSEPGKDGQHLDLWQDDIVQRNAAIDRLQGLAEENADEVPRIARLLSVYVRELSNELPAQTVPEDASKEELREWVTKLPKLRSDPEKAAQTLGRLRARATAPLDSGEIDLRSANLQRADLSNLDFGKAHLMQAQLQGAGLWGAQLQGADLWGAQLQGADLVGAELQGANLEIAQLQGANLMLAKLQGANLLVAQLQGADLERARFDASTSLRGATLRGAAVRAVDFNNVAQIIDHIADVFGDATTTLPDGITPDQDTWPDHWPKQELDWQDFRDQWHAWQATLPAGWDK